MNPNQRLSALSPAPRSEALAQIVAFGDEVGEVPTDDAYGDRRRLMIAMTKMRETARKALSVSP